MSNVAPASSFFLICHGFAGHTFYELSQVITAPNLQSAKRAGLDQGPVWTTDLHVEPVQQGEVNNLRMAIDNAIAEAEDLFDCRLQTNT